MPTGENNSKLFRVHVTLKRSISGGFLQGQSLSQVFDGQKIFIMMIQLPAAPCPSDTDTPLPFQGVWDRMLAFTLQILLQIKGVGYPKYQTKLCYGALPSGRQQENVPDNCWEREAGFWHGHSSLQGDSHSHTGESSRGSVGVQVCSSESSASAWDISCPKEGESRWQLDATNHRDRSPERTQCDTGSPRLWGKGRVRDKGMTLSVSTDVTEQVQNLILNRRLSLLGKEEKVSVQNSSSACDKHELW